MQNKAEEEYLARGGYYNPYVDGEEQGYAPKVRPQTTGGRRRQQSQNQRKLRNIATRGQKKRNSGQRNPKRRAMTARPKKRVRTPIQQEASYQDQQEPQEYGVRFNGIDPELEQEDIQVMMKTAQPPKIMAQSSIIKNNRNWDKDKSQLVNSHM